MHITTFCGSLIFAAVLAMSFEPALTQSYSAQCPIAGRYEVTGKNYDAAESYHGEATITSNDVGCYMQWSAPNTSEGSGTYSNGVLTIHFGLEGSTGVVEYTRQSSGELRGVWWMDSSPSNKGTETLFPITLAQP